jgi:choline dehydrogenase-like flavoprotein
LTAQRDLVRYYETLAMFALYSREIPASNRQRAAEPNPRLSTSLPARTRFQVAVVGSGPGGATTAAILAEAGWDVVLIEQGPQFPADVPEPFSLAEMLAKYRNGGQTLAFGPGKVAYVEAACLGGGSEINSGLYHRTPPEVLQEWHDKFGVEALDDAVMGPCFEAIEAELSVSTLRSGAPPASLKLHEGASSLGWRSVEVPRWFRQNDDGTGGTRQTMTRTYVPRFTKAGGQVLTGVAVTRLRREQGRWLLKASHCSGAALQITAEHVFVCAGAVQTPALLRRSGITRHVGDSLKLHPTVKVTARFAEPINSRTMGVPVHQVKEFAPTLSFGCSISTPAYLALGLLDHPAQLPRLREDWTHMANYYVMAAPEGVGSVRTIPGFRDALVRFKPTEGDWRTLGRGLRQLVSILLQAGATAVFPAIQRGSAVRTTNDLERIPESLSPRSANLMTIHLFSSCPMGENRAKCATDSFGAVHGYSNLYVNDASLLPTSPTVNPQGTIMAIARRNALRFLSRNRP